MRITGGIYKNRKLEVPAGHDIRPTSDRMRQTIFNMLHHANWLNGFQLEGAKVIDLFCGSGALGLEALSHGAASCLFVDRDIATVKINSAFLEKDKADFLRGDATQLGGKQEKFDLVFMDPPYLKDLIVPTVVNLITKNLLADNAILIVEAEKGWSAGDLSLEVLDNRTQSRSDLNIFRYNSAVE